MRKRYAIARKGVLLLFAACFAMLLIPGPTARALPPDIASMNPLSIDLANSDTSLLGSTAGSWAAYYEYNASILTIKQDPPPGFDGYRIWQSGVHAVQSVTVASGVTTEIAADNITVTGLTNAGRTPLSILAGAQPTVVLVGDNTFINDHNSTIANVPAGAALTFSGSGSVHITGTTYGTPAVTNNGDIFITGNATVSAEPISNFAAFIGDGNLSLSNYAVLNVTPANRESILAGKITIKDNAVLNAKSRSVANPAIIADMIQVSDHGELRTKPVASTASGINIRANGTFTAEDNAIVDVASSVNNGYGITNNGTFTLSGSASVTISTSGNNGHGIINNTGISLRPQRPLRGHGIGNALLFSNDIGAQRGQALFYAIIPTIHMM